MIFRESQLIHFLEATSNGDVWKVMIIEEGLSKNGKYYTKEALQKAIPLFEKSKVCFYEWKDKHFDHIPLTIEKIRPEGFPLQTAGWIDNVSYESIKSEGREATGLTGHLHLLTENSRVAELKRMLIEGWKKGLKHLLGLSINAEGPSSVRMLNGQPITLVNGITRVYSTDFVTQPAAGGELLQILESLNKQEGGTVPMFKKILETLKGWKPKLMESIDVENITEEEVMAIFESVVAEAKEKKATNLKDIEAVIGKMKDKKYEEAETLLKSLIEAGIPPKDETPAEKKAKEKAQADAQKNAQEEAEKLKKATEEAEKKTKDVEARMAEMDSKMQKRECREMLDFALNESGLPEPVKSKIKKAFEGRIFKEAELKESIKSERDTLAKLIESGSFIDLGDSGGEFVKREPVERLQASMDLTLGVVPSESEKKDYEGIEKFTSLREAYVTYTDDPMISGRLGPKAMSRLQEATDASFTYALGYSMQRRMLPEYKAIDPLWQKICVRVPIQDFKLQERIRWGGFGVLPQVQAARTVAGTPIDSATPSYPELGFPSDEEATYAISTKGGMVTITRRMIIDDDLKVLVGLPKKIGKAAALTLNQFVFDLMLGYNASGINAATIYDSAVMFVAAHKNIQTGALGYDNLYALLNDMYYQCEFGYSSLVATQLEAAGTSLVITTNAATYFKAGDLIWMAGEICRVDASDATSTLTISRGLFGTTDAQHLVAVPVYKVTQILALENPILWVPRALRGTALALKNSEKHPENAEGGVNTLRDSFDPIVSPYLRGDENNYYLSAKPSDVEGIEIGFLNGREEPEILVQDQPTQGNVFVYDTIRYKVRHEYGGAVTDFRAFAGAVVSGVA